MAGERLPGEVPYLSTIIFFLFFLAGISFIIFSKLTGLHPAITTGVPVAIMLTYAACLTFLRGLRLREDQAGDNLYYLGFLYTLTSLGVSLFQFTAAGAADQIVQNFGVAIASTIAGVALRVMFNQMRQDPEEVEHAARLHLAEAAQRVRRELDETVNELAHFRRTTEQQIAEGFDQVRVKMDTAANQLTERFDQLCDGAMQPLRRVSDEAVALVGTSSAKFNASAEQLTSALSSTGQHMAAQLEQISRDMSHPLKTVADEALQTVRFSGEKLSSNITDISSTIEILDKKLREMRVPDDVFETKIARALSDLTTSIKALSQTTDKLQLFLDRQATEVRLSGSHFSKLQPQEGSGDSLPAIPGRRPEGTVTTEVFQDMKKSSPDIEKAAERAQSWWLGPFRK